MENTELLVLRKTPYRETSLIVGGLSPDDGRFDFVMKGGLAPDKNKFPALDLFREIRVDFQSAAGDRMPTVYEAEPLNSYDRLADNPDKYLLACELGNFALENSSPELPCPELYGAVKHVLASLCGYTDSERTPDQCRMLVRLAYLNENGFLPEAFSDNPRKDDLQHRLMAILLEAAQGEMPLPDLPDSYWKQMADWTFQLCNYHHLKMA